jgi:hypothetical protein
MQAIRFQPFRLSPVAPVLPKWVLDQINNATQRPDYLPAYPKESDILIPAIQASGLTHEELCERMERRDSKTRITSEFIKQQLADEGMDSWFKMRLLKALDIPWENFRSTIDELEECFYKAYQKWEFIQKSHEQYREYGPRLFALIKDEYPHTIHSTSELLLLTRIIDMSKGVEFDPPSVETMAFNIAKRPESCTHKRIHKTFTIGGYFYYRLPDEVHCFDTQGNLLTSGDTTLHPPSGLRIIELIVRGVRVRSSVKIPPWNSKK